MKKTILKIAVCALLAAPVLSRGQDTNISMTAPSQPLPPPPPVVAAPPAAEIPAATNAAPAKPKKTRPAPAVTGKVLDVDTNEMTLTVGKHKFELTSETRIYKGGKPAILSDIAVDDKVGVTYKKDRDIFDAVTIIDSRKAEKSETSTNSVSGQN
jgi:hypothetical protein